MSLRAPMIGHDDANLLLVARYLLTYQLHNTAQAQAGLTSHIKMTNQAVANQAVFEFIGTVGGITVALSLVPQVIHTFRTKKAEDISYNYQFIYIVGW